MSIYERWQKLINGEIEPESMGDFALAKAYLRAAKGDSLMNIVIDMKMEMSHYKEEEFECFIFGYAVGQKDFLDKLGGLDLSRIQRDDDESTH